MKSEKQYKNVTCKCVQKLDKAFKSCSTEKAFNVDNQRWSRGHKAQGQGHTKNPKPRPRTAFPRTDTLEAKDRNARGQGQGHKRKCSPKKKSLHKNFSGDLSKKKGLHKNFSGDLHKKTFSKKFFKRFPKF